MVAVVYQKSNAVVYNGFAGSSLNGHYEQATGIAVRMYEFFLDMEAKEMFGEKQTLGLMLGKNWINFIYNTVNSDPNSGFRVFNATKYSECMDYYKLTLAQMSKLLNIINNNPWCVPVPSNLLVAEGDNRPGIARKITLTKQELVGVGLKDNVLLTGKEERVTFLGIDQESVKCIAELVLYSSTPSYTPTGRTFYNYNYTPSSTLIAHKPKKSTCCCTIL